MASILDRYDELRPGLQAADAPRNSNRDAAEDLVQEAFVKAWRAEQRGQELKPGYLWAACTTLALDYLRRARYQPYLFSEAWDLADPNPHEDELGVFLDLLDGEFGWLSPKLRDPVLLVSQGYSYAEIGEMLGVQENAVRRRLFYARQKARQRRRAA